MGFNLADQVEPLEYDFTTANPCPPELKDAKGIIPEPSPSEVDEFFARYYELRNIVMEQDTAATVTPAADKADTRTSSRSKAKANPEDLAARLEAWRNEPGLDDERKLVDEAFVDLLDSICKGSPTRTQIQALGHRARSRFLSWLQMEMMNPKGSMNGTEGSPSKAE